MDPPGLLGDLRLPIFILAYQDDGLLVWVEELEHDALEAPGVVGLEVPRGYVVRLRNAAPLIVAAETGLVGDGSVYEEEDLAIGVSGHRKH